MKRIFTKPSILIIVPFIIYFLFGIFHLTKFETADEHYWLYSNTRPRQYWLYNDGRIQQYWNAISMEDWRKTRINDKPGITLAYVAGIGQWFKSDLYAHLNRGDFKLSKVNQAEKVNLYFRLPILIFNGLFSLLIFLLLKKLSKSVWVALLASSLILLSPIIIGISQIVNPDALLWEFSFAAILAYLIFLENGNKKFAILSSLLLGLSLLTKYSSVILFPFFLAVMLAYFIENKDKLNLPDSWKRIRFHTSSYILIIFAALAIYAVLLPDNLLDWGHFMKGSLGFRGANAFFAAIFALDFLVLLDAQFLKSRVSLWLLEKASILLKFFRLALFAALPLVFATIIANAFFSRDWLFLFADPFDTYSKSFFDYYGILHATLMEFQPIVFSLIPFTLLSIIFLWIKYLLRPGKHNWLVFVFSLFIAVFIAAMIQQETLLTVRYGIMLFPALLTLAAIGINDIFQPEKRNIFFQILIFSAVLLASFFSLWQTKPFYFNYMSVLLPQQHLINDAWGYGGYEAAQYLNSLPEPEKIRVWSDYNGVCLFFNGRCSANDETMDNMRRDAKKRGTGLPDFTYFVATRRGTLLSSKLWDNLKKDYNLSQIWELTLLDRPGNFVRVYKSTNEQTAEK